MHRLASRTRHLAKWCAQRSRSAEPSNPFVRIISLLPGDLDTRTSLQFDKLCYAMFTSKNPREERKFRIRGGNRSERPATVTAWAIAQREHDFWDNHMDYEQMPRLLADLIDYDPTGSFWDRIRDFRRSRLGIWLYRNRKAPPE